MFKTKKTSAFYKHMAMIDAIPRKWLVFDSGKYGTYIKKKYGEINRLRCYV